MEKKTLDDEMVTVKLGGIPIYNKIDTRFDEVK